MAESSLSLKKADYEQKVGTFLGYGRGADAGDTAWTAHQEAVIRDCVESGIRQFYFPPPVEGHSHDWSFLQPVASISLVSGQVSLVLPDDFGGLQGKITVTSDDQSCLWPLNLTNEGRIRDSYAQNTDLAGRPLIAALVPLRGTTSKESSRFELHVFPEPDADYTLQLAYYILPECLSGSRPYAYGGMAHAETILESCLAIAEQRLDDAASIHSMKFMERLAASIILDRRNKPQHFGYNADRSDGGMRRLSRRPHGWGDPVTFEGVEYDNT